MKNIERVFRDAIYVYKWIVLSTKWPNENEMNLISLIGLCKKLDGFAAQK